MSANGVNFLFFIKSPNYTDLINLSLRCTETSYPQEYCKTYFQARLLKCRELIFMEPKLLASPSLKKIWEISAVIPKRIFRLKSFGEKLQKMGLEVVNINEVSPVELQENLRYTVVTKLAPKWNLVKNLLVQGKEFLTTQEPLRAIRMDIVASSDEIHLSLETLCFRMPRIKTQVYQDLGLNKKWIISQSQLYDEECYVLPRMAKVQIVTVSNYIPEESSFRTYGELTKHWNQMYGYCLPEVPEGNVLYYNVKFRSFGLIYTYPEFCVRPYGIVPVPRMDLQTTVSTFLRDFHENVRQICGQNSHMIELKASFPCLSLHAANMAAQDILPRCGTTYIAPIQRIPLKTIQNNEFFSEPNLSRNSSEVNKKHDIIPKCGPTYMTPIQSIPLQIIPNKVSFSQPNLSTGSSEQFKTELPIPVQERYVPKFIPKIRRNIIKPNIKVQVKSKNVKVTTIEKTFANSLLSKQKKQNKGNDKISPTVSKQLLKMSQDSFLKTGKKSKISEKNNENNPNISEVKGSKTRKKSSGKRGNRKTKR